MKEGSSLTHMAAAFGVTPSYLSAIEHGQKNVSDKIVDAAFTYFGALGPTREKWAALARMSTTHVRLDLTTANDLEREVYLAVGRKFKAMPHELKEQIRRLLENHVESEVPPNGFSCSQEDADPDS